MGFTLHESYETGADNAQNVDGANWVCQTFTTTGSYDITAIKIKVYRFGSAPGNCTVSIRATSAGKPTLPDLCAATLSSNSWTTNTAGEWVEFDVSATTLAATTMYAVVVRVPTGDGSHLVYWIGDFSSPGYAGGTLDYSGDSGSNWTVFSGADLYFETYSGAALGTLAGVATVSFVSSGTASTPKVLIGTTSVTFVTAGSMIATKPLSGTASILFTTVGYINAGDFINIHARRRLIVVGSDAVWIQD